jgi:(S)-2-hydroxyglutarate dehydrogenase
MMNQLMPTPAHGPIFAHAPARSAQFDVAVIGGGAVGLATAMALLNRRPMRLVVLEAEDKLAAHQTGHNSGVIHSGLYYKPGSLKARLCTEGREAMYAFCQQHNIPHDRCGKVVVATRESELPALSELERRGAANGLTGIRRLSAEELHEFEPHATGIAAVHVPQTGIVDYGRVARAYGDVVRQLGGEVRTNSKVNSVTQQGSSVHLATASGDIECAGVINCGGLQSDRIARMCGAEPGVQIVPFRGEYYQLVDSRASLVRNLIYPVPDPRFPFLGVHFTRMIGGGVEAGPNAVLALARHGYTRTSFNLTDALAVAGYGGFWKMAGKYWKMGMGEFYRSFSKRAFLHALRRLMPELQLADLVPGGAGVRAQALEPTGAMVDDFRIVCTPRMVHVLNAPSPAATASIAIGRYIAEQAAEALALPAATGRDVSAVVR